MAPIDARSTVKINIPKINNLTASAVKALEMTGAALLSEVKNAEVFPFKTGNLQNESTFVDDSHAAQGRIEIISSTPYARRLYYHPEYNFNHRFNANARGRWYEPWLPGGQQEDFAQKAFAAIYKKETGL